MATPPTAGARAESARTREQAARESTGDPELDAYIAAGDSPVLPPPAPETTGDPELDSYIKAGEARGDPASVTEQVAVGLSPPIDTPTDIDIYGAYGEVANEVRIAERRAGRPQNADAEAERVVNGLRHQIAPGEHTRLLEIPQDIAGMAVDATTPGSLPNRFAEALSPKWMYDDSGGVRSTAGWRVATGDAERRMAAKQRVARDMAYGISATNAKSTAEEMLNSGAPLLLVTTDNLGTTTAQTDVAREKVELPAGLQSVQDVGVGMVHAPVSLLNTVKDVADIVPYAGEVTGRLVGMETIPDALKAIRDWTIPDPLDMAAKWVAESPRVNAIPGTDALLHGYADTMRRQGGVLSGTVGMVNAVSPWDIDPEANGILNTLTRVAVAVPKAPEGIGGVGAEDVLNQTVDAAKKATKSYGAAAQTAYDAVTGDATAGEAGTAMARSGADILGVAKPLLMTGMEAVSYDAKRRETTIGWWMRVGGSALQGFATTYVAQVADKTLRQFGATSFRKHRLPGDVRAGGVITHALGPNASASALNLAEWAETLVPLLDMGDYLNDLATSVYNGDSLTSETMRVLDTLAYGTDWFSPETQRSLQPGGTLNEYIVDAAMAGDTFLPLDLIPGAIVKAPIHRGVRFYDGFTMGLATGPKIGDAAVQGAAWAFPGVTDRMMRGAADYEASRAKLDGTADRPAAPMPTTGKPVKATRATDAPTVHSAVLYAHFRREVEAGRDPVERLRTSPKLTDSALGRRASEVLTIVGALEQPRQVPLPTAATTPPPAATAPPSAPTSPIPAAAPAATAPPAVPPSAVAIAATPTRTPARTAILDAATDAHAVAKAERRGPLAAWSDTINAEPDVERRQGMALSAIGAHLGSTHPNAVLAAFQAAAAYTDGHGNFVTVPWPDADGLDQMSPRHIDLALDRLRNASPEQVWRNTIAIEHGERPIWVNEVSPARQTYRDNLVAMARGGRVAFSVADVDAVHMPILDRMAEGAVREGAAPSVEAFFASMEHRAGEPGVGELRQDASVAPVPSAKDLRERLKTTRFISNNDLLAILGDQRPEYLNAVADFIMEQRAKVRDGQLTNRDVAKAYIMTAGSQGSGANGARLVEEVLGSKLDPQFTTTSARGERMVRPEEAMAAWLFSPMGQRALDAIDRGIFDGEAWQSAARVRKVFGDDRINNMGVLRDPLKGNISMRNISEVTAALNEAGGDWQKVEKAVSRLNGIGVGKSPFIGHLIGFGDMPTLDAREISGWFTGRADIGALKTPAADRARLYASKMDSDPLARAFMGKIVDRFKALKKQGIPGTDLPDEVFGAVMHHWFWDALAKSKTEHAGVYEAMRLAQDEPRGAKGSITWASDGRATITLAKDADLSTLFHEAFHALRRMIPAEKMAEMDAYVQKTFGGWTVKAEEWGARQFESVLRTGEMTVPKGERARNPGLFDRLTDAFRTAARVLVHIYKSGTLPEVHPVFDRWMRDFMRLDGTTPIPERVIARILDENDLQVAGKLPADPETGTVPVDRVEGLNPERVASLEAQLARIAEMADGEEAGKPRRRKVHGMLNTIARWAPALAEEIKATRKAGVVAGGDIAYVRGLLDKAVAKAEPAPPTAPVAVVGEPSALVAAPEPSRPRKALDALVKRADEMIVGSENAAGADTMRRAKNVVVSTMATVMERAGEEGVATEAMARDRFGEAVVSDFLTGVREAYKTYRPGKDTTTDAARVAAVAKATDTFLRKTGAKQPDPVRIEPRLPAIMDDAPVPVAPMILPASAPPGIIDQPHGVAGGAWLDLRGKPRMMMDSTGTVYQVVIRRLRFTDIVPSHTQSLTAWRPGYPKELQNRLDAFARGYRLDQQVATFNPPFAMDPFQLSPTQGAITAWLDPRNNQHYATSGNGRYIVIERIREMAAAGDARAQTLVAEMDHAVDAWSRSLGLGNAQPGDILVPVLVDASLDSATLFARNSQASAAAEMASIEVVLSGAEVLRRSNSPVVLDLDRLPPELTDSTVGAYVEVNRDAFDRALTVLFPDAAARETLFAQGGQNLLEAVQSVLLAQIDPDTQAYAMRYGKEVVDRLVVAAPALVALDTMVGNSADLAPFRVGDYYRDAVELWRGAVKDKSTDPAKFVQYARMMGGQGNLVGATPLPVSKVSFALAMVMMQKLTPGGVFKQLRDLEVELRDAKRPRMFGAKPDHVKTVVDVLSGDTRIKDLVPAELPGTHAEAVELAQSIRERTLSDKIARQPDPVTEPPGFDAVQESLGEPVTDPRTLFQARPLQTDTPEFKAWFGGSKVVDENGKPLVQYHGTPAGEFDTFRVDQEAGAHFGTTAAANDAITHARNRQRLSLHQPDGARAFVWAYRDVDQNPAFAPYVKEANRLTDAQEAAYSSGDERAIQAASDAVGEFERKPAPTGYDAAMAEAHAKYQSAKVPYAEGERVIPVYLSIKNPLWLNEPVNGAWDHPMMVMIANDDPALRDFRGGDTAALVAHIKAKGYDGIAYRNEYEGKGSTSYIAFDPEQVKSAIANRGTFDPTNPNILFQHRDYREAAANASATGSPVETQSPLRDETTKVRLASPLHDETANVYGAVVQGIRDRPLMDRQQMLLALGYRGDQRVFDAVDLQARALAWSATSLLQGGELPMRYSRIGARVAVPIRRIAGVRARAVGLLGDLPKAVLEGVVKLGEREVVRLSPADADRFLVIRDYLIASGWSDSLTLSAQRLTRGDLVHGVAGGGVADLTTDTWRAFVGAVTDSQSGAMPFRGRADRVNLAAQLVWWGAQKRTEYDVLPRDAAFHQRAGYYVRSKLSAAIITASRVVLSGEMWAPDMPEHVRDIFDRYRRKMGRAPGDLAEALELAIWKARDDGHSRDTEILEGIRALSTRLDGLEAPISIERTGRGYSDLDELRGWLFADATPGPVKTSAPYVWAGGTEHVQHDLDRVVNGVGHPFHWQEILQHRDLVERIVRRSNVLDATTVDALAALRSGTIDADGALFLHGQVWAALAAAESFGLDVLTSAAGHSGDTGKMRERIKASHKEGAALDAYEDFFAGRFDERPGDMGRSVAARAKLFSSGMPVDTLNWVAETMNSLRTKWLTERFFDELVDNQYALDLTELWRSAHPDEPLPDLATRLLFSVGVRNAASAILLGVDNMAMGGVNKSGEPVIGSGNYTGITEVERYAAHAMIAKMGLRPDIAATRSAMKGQVTPNSVVVSTYRGAHFDAQGVRLATPDTTAYDTIDAWRPSEGATTLYGRDLFMGTPLAERIRELQMEQGPVGQLISTNLKDRTTGEKMVATFVDYWRQYKGSLVTGGPNGIAAAAMAGLAIAGGATLPAAALAGATGLLLSFRPKLSGFATNFLGGYLQGYTEYGALGALRAAFIGVELGGPLGIRIDARSSRAAIIATGHAIHLTRMKAPLSWAARVMAYAGEKVNGAIDYNGFIDPSGRVWTTMDIHRYGEDNGLDGTQARYESAERANHAIDRMGRMYGPQTPMGRIYTAVVSFFGRHALAENYRKLYEANDTYFKYSYFIRGIMDGMEPTESLNRALAATFDYSATAPIDRVASGFFLFWMYGRRTVDLTIRTLLTNPTRVLGPIRFIRAQNLQAPNADVDEDHVVTTETIPDYAQGRFAIGFLPAANPEQGGFKVSLQEALPVTAMRLINDISSLDLPALAGRGNPAIEMGFNAMATSTGGQRISFFRKKSVDSDVYWDVPMWFVKVDREAFGGSFAKEFQLYAEPTQDPSRWISPAYPYVYRVPPQARTKWDMFRNVAGMGAIFGNADIDQKSGGYTRWLVNSPINWLVTLDPANRYGFHQDVRNTAAMGGYVIEPTQMEAPIQTGPGVQGLRNYGAQVAPYSNQVGTDAALQRDVLNAAQDKLAALKQQEWQGAPAGKVDGVKPVKPTAPLGYDPTKPLGVNRR